MQFDRHTIVLLVRPLEAPELSEAAAAILQDAHLARPTCMPRAIWSMRGRSTARTTSGCAAFP
jgi:hypothetical protein